jgi:dynactin-4
MTSAKEKEGGDETSEAATAEPSGKMVSKKMYYLACLACRYSSRDVGISDQPSQNFCWPEQEYMHANRFNTILDHYQSVVLHDKQLKQEERRRRSTKQSKFPSMTVRQKLKCTPLF